MIRKTASVFMGILTAAMLTGCVSQKDYDALEAENESLNSQVEELQSQVDELNDRTESLRTQLEDAESEAEEYKEKADKYDTLMEAAENVVASGLDSLSEAEEDSNGDDSSEEGTDGSSSSGSTGDIISDIDEILDGGLENIDAGDALKLLEDSGLSLSDVLDLIS